MRRISVVVASLLAAVASVVLLKPAVISEGRFAATETMTETLRVAPSLTRDRPRALRLIAAPRRAYPLRSLGWRLPPISLAVVGRRLALLSALGELVELERGSSRVVWQTSLSALGVSPRRLIVAADRLLVTGDAKDSMVLVDFPSHEIRIRPSPSDALIQSGCALGSSVVLSTVDSAASFFAWNPDSGSRRAITFPWRSLTKADALQRQVILGGDQEGKFCVFALLGGIGFGVLRYGAQAIALHSYVEGVDIPDVEVRSTGSVSRKIREARLLTPMVGAIDVAISDQTIFVAFAGYGPYRGRLIDCYAMPSGGYLSSAVLPVEIKGLVAKDNTLFVWGYFRSQAVVAEFDSPCGHFAGASPRAARESDP